MKIEEYSHRHGKELCKLLHPEIHDEVLTLLANLKPFPHGRIKGKTAKDSITATFTSRNWDKETYITLSEGKKDYVDLMKDRIAVEMEWSKFEMFFRDFFRFMLLYERQQIDIGIILTYNEEAYRRWQGEAEAYRSSRASLTKLTGFLAGDYSSIVTVPLWCIGIE